MADPLWLTAFDLGEAAELLDPGLPRVEVHGGIPPRPAGEWLAVVPVSGTGPLWISGVVQVSEYRRGWRSGLLWYHVERRIALPCPVPLPLERFREASRPLDGELLQVVRTLCEEVQRGKLRESLEGLPGVGAVEAGGKP